MQTLAFELPEDAKANRVTVTVAGKPVAARVKQDGQRVVLTLPATTTIGAGESIDVELSL